MWHIRVIYREVVGMVVQTSSLILVDCIIRNDSEYVSQPYMCSKAYLESKKSQRMFQVLTDAQNLKFLGTFLSRQKIVGDTCS